MGYPRGRGSLKEDAPGENGRTASRSGSAETTKHKEMEMVDNHNETTVSPKQGCGPKDP